MVTDLELGCGFTHQHLRDALGFATSIGRSFVSFPEVAAGSAPPRFILLRHDIDHSTGPAVQMAELEAAMGVRATYFVLLSAEYNALGRAHRDIARIVELGHWLGIHYDPIHYSECGLPYPATVLHEASLLEARFGVPVRVAARHNPASSAQVALSLDPLLDAYEHRFTSSIIYRSDSCQFWREGCFCRALEESGSDGLQVLIHAEWWTRDGTRADVILEQVRDERVKAANDSLQETRQLFAGLDHLPHRALFHDPMDKDPR